MRDNVIYIVHLLFGYVVTKRCYTIVVRYDLLLLNIFKRRIVFI